MAKAKKVKSVWPNLAVYCYQEVHIDANGREYPQDNSPRMYATADPALARQTNGRDWQDDARLEDGPDFERRDQYDGNRWIDSTTGKSWYDADLIPGADWMFKGNQANLVRFDRIEHRVYVQHLSPPVEV